MLGAAMMHRIRREVDCGDVVTIDDGGLVDGYLQFAKEMPKPAALSSDIGHTWILRLRAGARHHSLSLGRPRDERVTKEHTEPRGGAPRVRAARPVRIGVGDELRRCRPPELKPLAC